MANLPEKSMSQVKSCAECGSTNISPHGYKFNRYVCHDCRNVGVLNRMVAITRTPPLRPCHACGSPQVRLITNPTNTAKGKRLDPGWTSKFDPRMRVEPNALIECQQCYAVREDH